MRPAALLLLIFPLAATLAPAAGVAAPEPQRRAAPQRDPNGPKVLGKFDDWTAATHLEGGQTVCYAFARAATSSPALPGRGEVVLTVAERPGGRDAVALLAGFPYAANAEVTVQVDQAALSFYTAQRSAFARESAATVAAFKGGRQAVVRSPGPRGTPVVDSFSLRGFAQAYQAIVKACPR
jgi:invasion protein IalB